MKNRIISLVLAIVMVVLAVPAFILPMTAAGTTGFKTVFGKAYDTWPLHDGENFLGYGTPWEVGNFQIGTGASSYRVFTGYDAAYDILNLSGADQWTYGGIYCSDSKYILTGAGIGTEVGEGTDGRDALVLNYVSPYEGKVTLGFDAIVPVNQENPTCVDVYIAIFLNGEMIWPVAGGAMDNVENWAHIYDANEAQNPVAGQAALEQFAKINPDALKNVEVTRGDNIQFALSRGGTSYCYAEPTVTFADGYLVVPTKINESYGYNSQTWPTIGGGQGNRTFKQTDARWTIGDIAKDGGEFTAYDHYFRKTTDSWACRTGEDYPGNGKNPSNGAVMLAATFADLRGGILFGDKTDYLPGFAYEAVATGTAVPSFEDLKLIGEIKGDYAVVTTGTAKISVYKNGTLVETVTATATADGVTVTMPEISVVRGDIIAIVAAPGTGTVGIAGNPTVKYTNVNSFMTETTDKTFAIKMENGTALFGDSFGVSFYTYATTEVYNNYTEAGLYVWKNIPAAERTAENATVIPATLNDSFAFVADYNDFVAKEMADVIAVQSYIKVVNGNNVETISSEIVEKSVADYISEQYATTKDADLKKVLIAMLNYGAYAQTYFGYNTDKLANAALAADEKAMDQEILYYATFDAVKGSTNNICNTEINAFALELNNTINLKVYLKVDPTELGSKMQLQVATAASDLGTGTKIDIDENNPVYVLEDLSLDEMSKTFYFRVTVRYGPTLYYGYTFSYSIESYAARMVDSTEPGLGDLVRAMMEFGKAINAYNA